MKMTAQWLRDKSVCAEGLDWFLTREPRERIDVISLLISEGKPQWANWLICRSMDRATLTKYAVYAAEKVLPVFEEDFPHEQRPRRAVIAGIKWIKNQTDKTKLEATIAFAGALDAAAETKSVAAYAIAYAGGAPTAATVQAITATKGNKLKQNEIFSYGASLL